MKLMLVFNDPFCFDVKLLILEKSICNENKWESIYYHGAATHIQAPLSMGVQMGK